jgi:hypothetical protein
MEIGAAFVPAGFCLFDALDAVWLESATNAAIVTPAIVAYASMSAA